MKICSRTATMTLACSILLLASAPAGAASIKQITQPSSGSALFVCKSTGKNSNPGTAAKPYKNIDKAMKKAKSGDTIVVCGGSYSGTFDIGYLETDRALKLYGGFSTDFSRRDLLKTPTLFQPDNKSGARSRKPLLRFKREVDGVVVDGFVFDMGQRNAYHTSEGRPKGVDSGMLLLPPKKMAGQKATVTESCVSIPSSAKGGNVLIRNNVFTNCAKFGIQAGLRSGKMRVTNNVFVANRMAGVEVYGTCRSRGGPKAKSKCGELEFDHNTLLFTWSRRKDFQDMGYGIRIMTKLGYDIHHNVIGTAVLAGVDHTRFNNNAWIKLDKNVFFVNKAADLEYSPQSNTKLNLRAAQFEDLELASVKGNTTRIPKGFPVDKAYLQGFLAARYSEKADYNPDSPANQLRAVFGLNKQGKLRSKATMFANRYPWRTAAKLFGAIKGAGAAGPR